MYDEQLRNKTFFIAQNALETFWVDGRHLIRMVHGGEGPLEMHERNQPSNEAILLRGADAGPNLLSNGGHLDVNGIVDEENRDDPATHQLFVRTDPASLHHTRTKEACFQPTRQTACRHEDLTHLKTTIGYQMYGFKRRVGEVALLWFASDFLIKKLQNV